MKVLSFVGSSDEQIVDKYGESAKVKYPVCCEWVGTRPHGAAGGFYDPAIFGIVNVCSCGNQTRPGRCKKCGDVVVLPNDMMKMMGYMELPVPYIPDVAKNSKVVQKYIREAFDNKLSLNKLLLWDTQITLVETDDPTTASFQKEGKFYELDITTEGTSNNINDYGLAAIYNICKNYSAFRGNVDNVLKYLHIYLPVAPIPVRPFSIFDGEFTYPKGTENYLMLMRVCDWANQIMYGIDMKSKRVNKQLKGNILDQLAIAYTINTACNSMMDQYSVLKPSHDSALRYVGTGRLDHSGRANIISAEVSIDTVLIPPSLAYEAMKQDIIEELRITTAGTNEDYYDRYLNPDKEVMDIFHKLVEGATVVINRPPTLHKYNMMAFKMKLWEDFDPKNYTKLGKDEACIGMNVFVTSPFNADFDGDQMSFYIFARDPEKSTILAKMGVANNWFYEKNAKPIFIPKNAVMIGLYAATKLLPRSDLSSLKKYSDFKSLELDYNNRVINYNTLVSYNGELTCYGIEKLKLIIHRPLTQVLAVKDNFECAINSKSIDKLIAYIGSQNDKIKIMNDIYDFANDITTHRGTSIIKLSELYNAVPEFPEIKKILDDPNIKDEQKAKILNDKLPDIVIKGIKELMPTLYEEYKNGGAKVKKGSIVESFMPRVEYDPKTETVKVTEQNFVTGLSEAEYVAHSVSTRSILDQKAKQVPDSGYMTRQVVDLMKNYVYISNQTSKDTTGILVKRGDAVGRWTAETNSKLLGTCTPSQANELVRVKSSIFNYPNDPSKFHIYADELNSELYKPEDRATIGFSVATATTESITQAQLGLKHGGNLLVPDNTNLMIPSDDEDTSGAKVPSATYHAEVEDGFLILKSGIKEYKFPLPKNALLTSETDNGILNPGDIAYYLKGLHYIDYSITKLCLIFGATIGTRDFDINKTKLFSTISHSPYEGTIHYSGKTVAIGSGKIPYNDQVVWYFPEGAKVNIGDRLNSGCVSPATFRNMNLPYDQKFHLYYLQLKELIPDLQLLSIELLFKSIFSVGASNIRGAIRKLDVTTAITHEAAKSNITRIIEQPIMPTSTSALLFNRGDLFD